MAGTTEPIHTLQTGQILFQDGPLGLELVDRKHGGVIVKTVTKGYQAAKTRIIRRSFGIYKINEVDYSQSDLKSVMEALRSSSRPLTIVFTLPGELNFLN